MSNLTNDLKTIYDANTNKTEAVVALKNADNLKNTVLDTINITWSEAVNESEDSLKGEIDKNIYGGDIVSESSSKKGTDKTLDEYYDSTEDIVDTGATEITDTLTIKTLSDAGATDGPTLKKKYKDNGEPPKESLMQIVAKTMKLYNEQKTFEFEANHTINCTVLTTAIMLKFLPPCFIHPKMNIGRSQCNQSIINFPISPSRTKHSNVIVSKRLAEIQAGVSKCDEIVEKIITNTSDDKGKKIIGTLSTDAAKSLIKLGQNFASAIVTKASILLREIVSWSPLIYPSIQNGLYDEVDYTDIFAFALLSYLMKAERDDTTIKGSKGIKEENAEKTFKDVLEFKKGKPERAAKEATDSYWTMKNVYLEGDKPLKSGGSAGKLTKGLTTTSDGDSHIVNDGSKKSTKTINKGKWDFYKEKKFEVFLKPGRFQKIILVTDPNYFNWRFQAGIRRALAMMVKIGILPEQVFTTVKICSNISGAIYNMKVNKTDIKCSLDKKDITYANMSQPIRSQYGMIIDCGCLKLQHKRLNTILTTLREQYPMIFYRISTDPTQNKYLFGTTGKIDSEQLTQLQLADHLQVGTNTANCWKLSCSARRHVFKTLTDKPLEKLWETAKNVQYMKEALSEKLIGLKEWPSFGASPARRDFTRMKRVYDIPINVYKKGAPFGENTYPSVEAAIKYYEELSKEKLNVVSYGKLEKGVKEIVHDPNQSVKPDEALKDYITRRTKTDQMESEDQLYQNIPLWLYKPDLLSSNIKQRLESTVNYSALTMNLFNSAMQSYRDNVIKHSAKLFQAMLSNAQEKTYIVNYSVGDFDTLLNAIYYGKEVPNNSGLYNFVSKNKDLYETTKHIHDTYGKEHLNTIGGAFLLYLVVYFADVYLKDLEDLENQY